MKPLFKTTLSALAHTLTTSSINHNRQRTRGWAVALLQQTLAVVGLTVSLSAHSAIVSVDSSYGVDTITRDTATGLDWLDVTVTRGLSFNQVSAQLGVGGDYEGYRYATVVELDQLIINFGYVAQATPCPNGNIHCDTNGNVGGQGELIEAMINTIGDTYDAWLDLAGGGTDVRAGGAGYSSAILVHAHLPNVVPVSGRINDSDAVFRSTGSYRYDSPDAVVTLSHLVDPDFSQAVTGSLLVASSPVPLPAAGWLFVSALLGLAGRKHLARR